MLVPRWHVCIRLAAYTEKFDVKVSHLSCDILTFKKLISTEKYFSLKKNNSPKEYFEFPIGIKELPLGV